MEIVHRQDEPQDAQNKDNPSKTPLLDTVFVPQDMKGFTDPQLRQLADEVRTATIHAVSKTGGHLGAGLGVVELTTAIHAVFDTPKDKLIWDVGHQCYPHKILTGRKDKIETLRKGKGLSGFTKRAESEYDPFGAAHSSTSISAGLGMAVAHDLKGEDSHVIAVIGDGAMSAGMAYEAMNNAGTLNSKLIVILNDNNMSIAPPVGAMSGYLSGLVSSKPYLNARDVAKKFANMLPEPLKKAAARAEETARIGLSNVIGAGGTLFEEMGFYYVGPVDGHDMTALLSVLRNVKDNDNKGPILIHAITQKGKGYAPAEKARDKMHGVAQFDVVTGNQFKSKNSRPSYTRVFADSLIEQAHKDPQIVGITAAMPDGTGMDLFGAAFPNRMFDVGIAEQHAVTFAAGLATQGLKPFCAIYSTFLQRGYDQVVHDVAIQNLPVRFAIDRAGLVGADGSTHAGSFDIAYLGCLPNFVLMAAADELELKHMVATAVAYNDGPIAFRYPRGEGIGIELDTPAQILDIGKGRLVYTSASLRDDKQSNLKTKSKNSDCRVTDVSRNNKRGDIAILSYGTRLEECKLAARMLEEKDKTITLADARFAKPLDTDLITNLAKTHDRILTIEEGSTGGFGALVADYLTNEGLLDNGACALRTMHLPDLFQDQHDPTTQYAEANLTAKDIVKKVI